MLRSTRSLRKTSAPAMRQRKHAPERNIQNRPRRIGTIGAHRLLHHADWIYRNRAAQIRLVFLHQQGLILIALRLHLAPQRAVLGRLSGLRTDALRLSVVRRRQEFFLAKRGFIVVLNPLDRAGHFAVVSLLQGSQLRVNSAHLLVFGRVSGGRAPLFPASGSPFPSYTRATQRHREPPRASREDCCGSVRSGFAGRFVPVGSSPIRLSAGQFGVLQRGVLPGKNVAGRLDEVTQVLFGVLHPRLGLLNLPG